MNKKSYKVREIIAYIENLGFRLTRIKGSHSQFHNHEGILITIPGKANDVLDRGTLRAILRQACLKK